MDQRNLIVGYWIAMGLAFLAVFFPWASVSASINIPGVVVESHNEHANGLHVLWGWLTLLSALAGRALSLIGPIKVLREKTRWVMAGIGGAITLWALINFIVVHSHDGPSASDLAAMKDSMKFSISAGLGTWLALLSGLAAAAAGHLLNWETVQPVIKNEAVDSMVAKSSGFVGNLAAGMSHQTPHQRAEHRVQEAVRKLEAAKASGVLSEEEFNAKKSAEMAKMGEYEAEYEMEKKLKDLQHALSTGVITQAEYDAKAAALRTGAAETPVV